MFTNSRDSNVEIFGVPGDLRVVVSSPTLDVAITYIHIYIYKIFKKRKGSDIFERPLFCLPQTLRRNSQRGSSVA